MLGRYAVRTRHAKPGVRIADCLGHMYICDISMHHFYIINCYVIGYDQTIYYLDCLLDL